MSAEVELRGLARERPEKGTLERPRKSRYLSRYVVPAVVVAGFVSLFGWAVRDQFLRRKPVTVVPVIVARAEMQQEGTALFQAAGWIEPRPTAAAVAALIEGIVESLFVVEGQDVTKGAPVAQLIDVDARLALREAEIALVLREAELQSAEAEVKAARLRLMNPVHLDAALAEAESQLAKTETELAKLPFLAASATAQLEYARQNLEGKQGARDAISGRVLQQAEAGFAAANAELEELKQRGPRLRQEVESLRQKRDALAEQRELLIDESRQLADGEAKLLAAEARRDQAKLAVEKAQLSVERTVLRSPIDGRVLQLVASPGARVMGIAPNAEHDASTIVTLYDPDMLQVRADVRLEDVPYVQPGQPVVIETASSTQPLHGRVLTVTSAANIQKNTLEVKVAIDKPPPTIRPEMLVTATFLAPPVAGSTGRGSDDSQRLMVPRQLVEGPEGSHLVWVVDAENSARRRGIRLGRVGTGELVEVVEGLAPTDKLISGGREGLNDGDRVVVSGEDARLGMTASGT